MIMPFIESSPAAGFAVFAIASLHIRVVSATEVPSSTWMSTGVAFVGLIGLRAAVGKGVAAVLRPVGEAHAALAGVLVSGQLLLRGPSTARDGPGAPRERLAQHAGAALGHSAVRAPVRGRPLVRDRADVGEGLASALEAREVSHLGEERESRHEPCAPRQHRAPVTSEACRDEAAGVKVRAPRAYRVLSGALVGACEGRIARRVRGIWSMRKVA